MLGWLKGTKESILSPLLGKVVYDSQMTVGKALQDYWKLKAIEQLRCLLL